MNIYIKFKLCDDTGTKSGTDEHHVKIPPLISSNYSSEIGRRKFVGKALGLMLTYRDVLWSCIFTNKVLVE